MGDDLKKRLSKYRLLLGNPYAGIEWLEERQAEEGVDQRIRAKQAGFHNPYRFVEGDDWVVATREERKRASAVGKIAEPIYPQLLVKAERPGDYSEADIEIAARRLQRVLWKERDLFWRGKPPGDPVDIIDPEVALRAMGYDFSLEDGLGQYRGPDGHLEVAGIIDNDARTVRISRQFKLPIRAYTAAHELGHAVLHPDMRVVHRDRPMDGADSSRDPVEREAEKFAAFFLMPAKLVIARFTELFGTNFFELTDATAFALKRKSLRDVLKEIRTGKDLRRLLASTDYFNGVYVLPLAQQFGVSIAAMAKRLEELELVRS